MYAGASRHRTASMAGQPATERCVCNVHKLQRTQTGTERRLKTPTGHANFSVHLTKSRLFAAISNYKKQQQPF